MRKNGMNLICIVCGKIFYERMSKIKRGCKCCSSKCYHKSREIHSIEQSKALKKNCLVCGKLFKTKLCEIKRGWGKYCSKKCYGIILQDRKTPGDKHFNWNGGKHKTFEGYVMAYAPNHPEAQSGRYVLEHRLVVEKHLGRFLNKNEVVHHINEIKDDNRIENLQVLSPSQHTKLHKTKN